MSAVTEPRETASSYELLPEGQRHHIHFHLEAGNRRGSEGPGCQAEGLVLNWIKEGKEAMGGGHIHG